jgi:sulfite reductase (ferredoxin)
VIDVVLKIIELCRQERNEGESLQQWTSRVLRGEGSTNVKNAEALKAIVDAASKLPSPEESPESYKDYGNEGKFSAKTARGECAA